MKPTLSLRLSFDASDYLDMLAKLHGRSKNRYIEWLIVREAIREWPELAKKHL